MKTTTEPTEVCFFLPTSADPDPTRELAYHIAVVDVIDLEDGSPPFRRPGSERTLTMDQAEKLALDLGGFVRAAIDAQSVKDRDAAKAELRETTQRLEQVEAVAAEAVQLRKTVSALLGNVDVAASR